ncbi:hypothetical protein [Actinobaculum suis]|uniref:Uncharacterized protein n=1 Tax=Actinobaculum suis TaxID=1657 RepID=A0AAW9HJX5_9ACTO|nr:hypothetical protein [Actinobaculum suis]MDY5154087.1 hypothetical protein [Actinobaculum suis]
MSDLKTDFLRVTKLQAAREAGGFSPMMGGIAPKPGAMDPFMARAVHALLLNTSLT